FVIGVGDAVLVVVEFWASVLVFEVVLVFGIRRAFVDRIRDAVSVPVQIGASFLAGGALGVVGAAVLQVGNAVFVIVGNGASLGDLESILVLRLNGTFVIGVGDPLLVIVGLGASVGVLEPVLVLGLVGAFVVLVLDRVSVVILLQDESRPGDLEEHGVIGNALHGKGMQRVSLLEFVRHGNVGFVEALRETGVEIDAHGGLRHYTVSQAGGFGGELRVAQLVHPALMIELGEEPDEGTGLVFGRSGPEKDVFERGLGEDISLAHSDVGVPEELEFLGHLPQIQSQSQPGQEGGPAGAERGRSMVEFRRIVGHVLQFAGNHAFLLELGRDRTAQEHGDVENLQIVQGQLDLE